MHTVIFCTVISCLLQIEINCGVGSFVHLPLFSSSCKPFHLHTSPPPFHCKHHTIVILTNIINTTRQKTSGSWWRITCTRVRFGHLQEASPDSSVLWCTNDRDVAASRKSGIGRASHCLNMDFFTTPQDLQSVKVLHDTSGSSRHQRRVEAGDALYQLMHFRYYFISLIQDGDTRQPSKLSYEIYSQHYLVRSCIPHYHYHSSPYACQPLLIPT